MPTFETNINPPNPVEVPKPPARHSLWLWLVLVLAVAGLAAVNSQYFKQKTQEPAQDTEKAAVSAPTPAASQEKDYPPPTVAGTQKMLEKKSQISSPQVESAAAMEASEIPDQLKNLILPGASQLSVKKLSLAGGKSGFEINYTAPEDMETTYRKLLIATSKWQAKIAVRALLATSIERESDEYLLKITQIKNSDSENQVLIRAFGK